MGPLAPRVALGVLFPLLPLSFPTRAGAHTPQVAVTASKAVRGYQGAGTHPQGGAPGKRSPGRGLHGKGPLREGGSHGASAYCGEGAAPQRERGKASGKA